MERFPINEPSQETELGKEIRLEIEAAGGIGSFLRASVKNRLEDREDGTAGPYRANIFQLRRLAVQMNAPKNTPFEISGQNNATAFYWGEILGMEVGDFVFDEEWADYLYKTLSAFELAALQLAHKNELRPDEYQGIGAAAPSLEVSRTLLLANLMIGILEDEENALPLEPELETLCDGFIADLHLDEKATVAAQQGYMLIMKAFTKFVVDLTKRSEEANMGVLVDRVAIEGDFDAIGTL